MKQAKWKARVEIDNFGRFYGRKQNGAMVLCDYGTTREQAYQMLNRG